jgi:acyl transferase domain-containing protein/acyl carrier protein
MSEPIAVVGMACRFPGGADDPDSFWELLAGAIDAIGEIPGDRIDLDRFFDPTPRTPGRMATRWGGFLDRLDQFDADFFGISPREAATLDPAQRLLMETTWEAFEDATIDPHSVAGRPVGIFVGQWASDFEGRLFARTELTDFHATTGSGRYAASGRLSFLLDSVGPSLTVDTACSSSLVAVHLACQSLRSGESAMAVAGGVNLILQPHITIAYSQNGMMAPDGRCKFGDADGDGYVRSEGVGVVLLKTLSAALAEGDRVRALILGTSVNNDGRESGLMARPSRAGQAAMLRTAYANAGVSPHSVSYVEAHGTGTRAGDPVEIGALADVLAVERSDRPRCLVGSVKTNIGHTEGAAGVAGLIKTVLALEHREIPASLHLRNPNPAIDWEELPFEIPTELVPWSPPDGEARIAGVSAYGITGTNAHAVVSEAPPEPARPLSHVSGDVTLVLAAAAPRALRTLAAAYAERLAVEADLGDVCATAARHRAHMPHRAAFVAADRHELVGRLRRFADGDDGAADASGHAQGKRRIGFVFAGQGGQWYGMGRGLLATEPVFAATIDACDAALPPGTGWSLRAQLEADPDDPAYRLDEISVLQPTLVAVELAIAAVWRAWGVNPESVVGHSMGEVASAYFAGALTLDDAMQIICTRSELLQRTRGHGAMALLDATPDEAAALIADYGNRVVVAVCNSPRSTVVSGDTDVVDRVLATCERDGVFARPVKVDVASHSTQMDPLVPELVQALAEVEPRPTCVNLYSSVDTMRHPGIDWNADYWGGNLRQPVRFGDTVTRMLADGIDTFVEINAHPTLLPSIAQVKPEDPPLAVASMHRDQPERRSMLVSLGTLWVHGHDIDWSLHFPDRSYRRVPLPRYPWQRQRHWSDAADPVDPSTAPRRGRLDEAAQRLVHVLRWVPVPVDGTPHVAGQRWFVVGDPSEAAALCSALASLGAESETAGTPADAVSRGAEYVVILPRGASPFAPVADVQSLGRPPTEPALSARLWWVTHGAQLIGDDEPLPATVEQAAMWGALRVIAIEHPEIWGGVVDLDPAAPAAFQIPALAGALTAGDGEDQVVLRGGHRLGLRLADDHQDSVAAYRFRSDGAYLVTGGLGGIAAHLALAMADAGARRFVLLSRTPLPPRRDWGQVDSDSEIGRRIATVRALEHAGAAVHVLQGDVADETQLRAAIDAYTSEQWPPIVGVVHAAGVLDSQLVEALDEATFDRVMHPKLAGARALERVLPDVELFVACSSVMGFWPPAGMANYAAANTCLDAFVQARRRRGKPGLSILWGPWADVGMLAQADSRNVEALEREGIERLSPSQAVACFEALLAQAEPVVAVLGIDWAAYDAAHRGRPMTIFRDRDTGAGSLGAPGLADRLANSPAHERRALLQSAIAESLGAVMKLSPSAIDVRRPFGALGLDSLMALELRNRLERVLERPLPATLAWNYPTIEGLADHLAAQLADGSAPIAPPGPIDADAADGATKVPADVRAMSDDEALRLLRGGA